ncbi:enzymatic polyprotein, partial [Dinothrombium tinctorium]
EGVKPDRSKIEKVENFKAPKNLKQLLSFLGLVNYYRRFIKNIAEIEHPLRQLTRKDAKFIWTEVHEKAFQLLKSKLITQPILAHFDPKLPIVLKTDASGIADAKFIWTEVHEKAFQLLKSKLTTQPILAHFDPKLPIVLKTDASGIAVGCVLSQMHGNVERVVGYDSHPFNKAERNYPTIQKEGLGIMYGLQAFRTYLHGRHFTIKTDHSALIHIRTMQNKNMRLRKWAAMLEEYDFEIDHKKGKNHLDADCMSRYFSEEELEASENADGIEYDPPDICETFHDSLIGAHLGFRKTYNKIKARYWWRNMKTDVLRYVRSCDQCQRKKDPHCGQMGNLQPLDPVAP